MTAAELGVKGIPANVISLAVKSAGQDAVNVLVETCRARLASTSAGKLAEYRFKEEIARDPTNAATEELAMIDREAAARGIDRDALLAEIRAKASAFRQVALLIGALEAEAKAAIKAIPDADADIEAQIQTLLSAARAQAETSIIAAQTQINGSS